MADTKTRAKTKSNKYLKLTGLLLVSLVIFWLGVQVGNGRVSIGTLKSNNKSLPTNLDYAAVEQIYDSLKANYDGQLNLEELLDGLKHGLAQSAGDPYTDYFNPKEAKAFNDALNGTFQGIGAELGKDSSNNLIVVSPIDGFPADKAGLKAKDIIGYINDESTSSMSVDEAVNKIRGPKGTKVTLKVLRNKSETITLAITRDDIRVKSVKSKVLDGNIGYLKINEFSDDTGELSAQAANDFKQARIKGVILDLRGNPGGDLDAAVDVSGLWLTNGQTVLTTRRGSEIVDSYYARGPATLAGIPTVVLIDEGSASAAEIVAGALHDNKIATVIGTKSFGKGSVQSIINLNDGAMLKVTMARWYTPNGKNIDKQGIEPDKKVEITEEDTKAEKDPQLDAALTQLNN